MHRSWKISYWIIGSIVLIMIITLIPWEKAIPTGPKVGIVEINMPISNAKKIIKNINYFLEESTISAIILG